MFLKACRKAVGQWKKKPSSNCPSLLHLIKDSKAVELCVFSRLETYGKEIFLCSHQSLLCWVTRHCVLYLNTEPSPEKMFAKRSGGHNNSLYLPHKFLAMGSSLLIRRRNVEFQFLLQYVCYSMLCNDYSLSS